MLRSKGLRLLWNIDIEIQRRYWHTAEEVMREELAHSQGDDEGETGAQPMMKEILGTTTIEENGGGGCLHWLLVETTVVTAVCQLADDLWLLV